MSTELTEFELERQTVEKLIDSRARMESELSKVIIGQKEVTHQLLISLFAGGHCLLTGAPGLAKTLLVSTIAKIFELKFRRIQFTPDLMDAEDRIVLGRMMLDANADARQVLELFFDVAKKVQPALVENYVVAADLALSKSDI